MLEVANSKIEASAMQQLTRNEMSSWTGASTRALSPAWLIPHSRIGVNLPRDWGDEGVRTSRSTLESNAKRWSSTSERA